MVMWHLHPGAPVALGCHHRLQFWNCSMLYNNDTFTPFQVSWLQRRCTTFTFVIFSLICIASLSSSAASKWWEFADKSAMQIMGDHSSLLAATAVTRFLVQHPLPSQGITHISVVVARGLPASLQAFVTEALCSTNPEPALSQGASYLSRLLL